MSVTSVIVDADDQHRMHMEPLQEAPLQEGISVGIRTARGRDWSILMVKNLALWNQISLYHMRGAACGWVVQGAIAIAVVVWADDEPNHADQQHGAVRTPVVASHVTVAGITGANCTTCSVTATLHDAAQEGVMWTIAGVVSSCMCDGGPHGADELVVRDSLHIDPCEL